MTKLIHKEGHRNSYTELNEPYFWTITIRNWKPLLQNDSYKEIITSSLKWLAERKLITVYGFVIMPNHIHLLWTQLKMNSRELPKNSFEKFTAHEFAKKLSKEKDELLKAFHVDKPDRKHNFWQRDPLAVKLFSREMCEQKLEYIHNNPLQDHWRLCKEPVEYAFSSAKFYEQGIDDFGFLTHYLEHF